VEWLAEGDWSVDRRESGRRSLRDGIIFSVALHGALVLSMMTFSSSRSFHPASVVTVDLIAAIPAPSQPSTAKPRPTAPPKPVPVKPKKVLLPKKPSPTSTKPRPAPPPPKPKPEELEYEDAMAKLREEMGEPAPSAEVDTPAEAGDAPLAMASSSSGRAVDKEIAEWALAARRHVRSVYVTPPEFLSRNLVTELSVRLSASGAVLGTPKVVRSSGDPYWDDNAVRALMRASPLPAPPESGVWPFAFPSVDR